MNIYYHASRKPRAQAALEDIKSKCQGVPLSKADVIVVLGGDGTMLRALHEYQDNPLPIFGLNLGTLGFLLNPHDRRLSLENRIAKAEKFTISPLEMTATDKNKKKHKKVAYNEVSLLRETHNSAKIKVDINGKTRLEELVCDGILIATPVGSTAYNLSAGGQVLPLDSNLLPITPISPFRPRRWKGALIRDDCTVKLDILRSAERPVSATADWHEVRDVRTVTIQKSKKIKKTLLFDADNPLEERVFKEQFAADCY